MFRFHIVRFAVVSTAPVCVLSYCPQLAAAESVEGRVTQATLYRGQAQITRTVPIDGKAGGVEIVVSKLPEQIEPNSLFAEGGDAVEIRAVRFRTRAVGEQPREEVRKLDREILDTQQQIDLTTKQQALLAKRTEYLGKMEGFVVPSAHTDLAHGVLDAESLEKLSKFSFEEHEKVVTQEVELAKKAHELNEQLALLQRKHEEITAGASRTEREAVLFLQKQVAGPAEVRLNYLVNNCGWSPAYTMRSGEDRKKVRIEYNALIHQLSGEDWTNVNLTLSTASPALGASGPGLAPFHVTLAEEGAANAAPNGPGKPQGQPQAMANMYGRGLSKGQVLEQLQGLNLRKNQSVQAANNSVAFAEQNKSNWNLNDVAYGLQQLEINGDATTLGVLRSEKPDEANGPSLSYQLTGNVSLASRSDQQMVRIMQTDMRSKFYHVAVPVLTSFVYREAELANSSDQDLLAGPITVYLDGRFVGRGEIPTVARGQTFVVGFGADPQLRARRELVDKQDGVQGGNRETKFEYRLVVENFAKDKTLVRVLDRLPHAENNADIRVTLGETSDPISADKLYQREERPMGILRWEIEAPAQAAGENARLIKYHYKVEYDRQFVVSLPEGKQSLQDEFERLQRGRQKR
jgi:hypothetical protein